jgi:hypothetical protein
VRALRRSVAAGLIALTCAGCGVFGRVTDRLPAATADDLLQSLASRRGALQRLRARARIRTGLASMWTREAVILQRPRSLRIDVLAPFGLAMAFGTDGTVLWAYPPRDGVRYEGPASPENLARVLGASIAVDDLVDVLCGLPPARLPTEAPRLEKTPDRQYRLTLPLADGTQQLWFRGDPLMLVRAEEIRTGQPPLQVAFSDHTDGFPHTIEVLVPNTGNTVTLRYDLVEPNAVIDPSVFAPPDAPAVRPLPTGAPG